MNPSLILCPVTYSANGKAAIAQALALARWYDAEVHLLQLRGRRSATRGPVVTPLGDSRVDRRLAEFVTGLNTEGVDVWAVKLLGDPLTSVGDYATRTGSDLVVVAKHGRPFGSYWRPGVYATDVARHVGRLTLAVPEGRGTEDRSTAPFTDILCPTDLSPASTAALDHALALAQQSGGRITLLHVLERFPYETVYSGSRAFRLIDEYHGHVRRITGELRRAVPPDVFNWCEVRTKVMSGVAHASILATAAELNADLIVMGSPNRSAVDRIVMGSTTSPVLRRAQCPVLVVPGSRGQDSVEASGAQFGHANASFERVMAPRLQAPTDLAGVQQPSNIRA
jgi:nucleotide-binding universal stress UspA family protein